MESFVYPDRVSILEIGDPQNTMVIDVEAGPNTNLGKYVQSKGGKYVALDINSDFLKRREEEGNSEFPVLADARSLPFASGPRDEVSKILAHVRFLLMNLPDDTDKERVIEEAFRVAGKDGTCLFIDYDWSSFKGGKVMEEFGKLCKEVLQRMGVNIYFGSQSKEFIEGVMKEMGISG
ncbi:MAG: methyltransferase domain-containing protein [Candidatus Jordarchaeaceae archaeon]